MTKRKLFLFFIQWKTKKEKGIEIGLECSNSFRMCTFFHCSSESSKNSIKKLWIFANHYVLFQWKVSENIELDRKTKKKKIRILPQVKKSNTIVPCDGLFSLPFIKMWKDFLSNGHDHLKILFFLFEILQFEKAILKKKKKKKKKRKKRESFPPNRTNINTHNWTIFFFTKHTSQECIKYNLIKFTCTHHYAQICLCIR